MSPYSLPSGHQCALLSLKDVGFDLSSSPKAPVFFNVASLAEILRITVLTYESFGDPVHPTTQGRQGTPQGRGLYPMLLEDG